MPEDAAKIPGSSPGGPTIPSQTFFASWLSYVAHKLVFFFWWFLEENSRGERGNENHHSTVRDEPKEKLDVTCICVERVNKNVY